MSAIFTKGVETGRRGGGGKKDKLFHNNHRKHSPSDSPGGLHDPLAGLARKPAPGWKTGMLSGQTEPGRCGWEMG